MVDKLNNMDILNHMVEYNDNEILSELLKAVSDTTRRSLLTRLCQQGPSRVTDIAKVYDMSLNAISKHIKVLEKAELVSRMMRCSDDMAMMPITESEKVFVNRLE